MTIGVSIAIAGVAVAAVGVLMTVVGLWIRAEVKASARQLDTVEARLIGRLDSLDTRIARLEGPRLIAPR